MNKTLLLVMLAILLLAAVLAFLPPFRNQSHMSADALPARRFAMPLILPVELLDGTPAARLEAMDRLLERLESLLSPDVKIDTGERTLTLVVSAGSQTTYSVDFHWHFTPPLLDGGEGTPHRARFISRTVYGRANRLIESQIAREKALERLTDALRQALEPADLKTRITLEPPANP